MADDLTPPHWTSYDYEAADRETMRLAVNLDITNADHIALWLEANARDSSFGWLACRIVEAHEAADRLAAMKDAAEKLHLALMQYTQVGCPVCNGDCSSANPPVMSCPVQLAQEAYRAFDAIQKWKDASHEA